MLAYLIRRLVYALPIMLGVALVCFALVHLAPGDPLVSVLPPDASAELAARIGARRNFEKSSKPELITATASAAHTAPARRIRDGRKAAAITRL